MMMSGTGLFMMLIWILVLGLLIYGAYQLFTNRPKKEEDSALSILEEQFARGEIDEAEYERRKNILTKDWSGFPVTG